MVRASSKKFRAQKHRSFKPYIVAGVAAFILVITTTAGVFGYKKIHSDYEATAVLAKQTRVQAETTDDGTSSNDLPTEDNPPMDISTYVVGDTLPRFLKIDKLGVNARVRRVGADNENGVRGPRNIYDVGWYENSSRPGDNGTALIDGHVSGQNNRGVFFGLGILKKGDKIVIERGDGKKLSYSVVSVEQAAFDNLDMHKVLNSAVDGKPGLNLMTASGRYNVRTNQYEKRVIVYAVQD
jgi:LPXTG-site transpeptidase (sortase) family protein